ncbi:hypothetical protein BN59_00457 [Legionella massiliensis]|uniref:Uncharacterized protein n=1 Tax=Legionella massiliensis TaxID=1034943 RepID=A0A078KSY9_9GAMM|nr:hypothetical protein [Legionella massiliensis]CDZ76191.1 hypothetical protein BN59_00457 [Legionella massiliensis]CEE11929.1 hypothetical protein BN1094_00457 [Legionella massiliensis]
MPFHIQGTAKQVFERFGCQWLMASGTTQAQVNKDIARTLFFGTSQQHDEHLKIWSDPEQSPPSQYAQGNMFAGNLMFLFAKNGVPRSFFKKEELELGDPLQAVAHKISTTNFAYIDEEGNPRGLLIYYRQDDPTQWFIAHTKNANKAPDETQIEILTSFEPEPVPVSGKTTCKIEKVSSAKDAFLNSIGSPRLERFVRSILGANNRLNLAANKIDLFTQYVSTTNGFEDNVDLLDAFDNRLDDILANPIYALLRSFRPALKLAVRQMLNCLDPNSPLSRLISQYPLQEDDYTNKRRLGTIIFLDKWNLNHRQELFAADEKLEQNLQSLLGRCEHEFLVDCLANDLKWKGVQFLTKISAGNQHLDFVQQLSGIEEEAIWGKLAVLADLKWEFPKDNYHYLFACKYLLNSPTTSLETLLKLADTLSPGLQEVFEPTDLADHLTSPVKDDGGLRYLQQAKRDFSEILPKYKKAAAWRKVPLPANLLAELGEKYKNGAGEELLAQLGFCSSVEQFKAAYSLADIGFSLIELQGLVMDPDLVFIINSLNKYNLGLNLLRNGSKLAVFKEIRAIKDSNERDACLILFAQRQLKADEYFQFRESCKTYPRLAALVVEQHKQGLSEEELKELAFDPTLHRSASFLSGLGIKYEFSNLTPLLRQTTLAIADLAKENKDDSTIDAYLKAVLLGLLKFYGDDGDLEEMQKVLADARIVAEKKLAEGEEPLEMKKEFALIKKLEAFLKGQITLCTRASELEIPQEQLLMNSRVHAHEAARALALVDIMAKERKVDLLAHVGRLATLGEQILKGFASLDAKIAVNEEITTEAVNALIEVYLDNDDDPEELAFERLLTNRKLTRAILGVAQHNLPVQPLLDLEEPESKEILAALNDLNEIGPKQREGYELAMQDDEQGHDFRLLLSKIPVANQPELVQMLSEGIIEERTVSVSDGIAAFYKNQKLRNLAYRLDESLIIVNRLRELDFDDDVIEFALKDNEKSRYFFNTVAKIEAESGEIRSRLLVEHKTKYDLLEAGPEKDYRKTLYQTIYSALNAEASTTKQTLVAQLEQGIKDADAHIEPILPIESHPWLRTAKMIIANLVMGVLTVLTLGAAGASFYQHYEKTGDVLFFARPASEESYNAINKQTLNEVTEIINTTPTR